MSEPVPFTDYDTRLAAYAVVVDDRDRILLALWNEGPEPEWTMPGGGVELHESTEEGVVRELREETGYDVRVGAILGVDTHVVPVERRLVPTGRPMKSVRVVFEAEVVGGELTHEVEGTTDEARWIPLDEVAGLSRVSLVDTAIRLWRDSRTRVG
ncbi:MAG TPA: NUDIX domain-containing protein [Nocardioides sp.]|nr:NUDIX domain-containing protein [Nocardioides sp.]